MAKSTPRRRGGPTRRRARRDQPVRQAAEPSTPPDPEVESSLVAAGASPFTPPPRSRVRSRLLAALWVLVTLLGAALLVVGLFGTELLTTDRLEMPAGLPSIDLTSSWLPQIGSVVVATTYVWALAARTGGRPFVFALLTAVLGVVTLWADRDVLRSGSAVMVCVVSAVLAVVATIPAVKLRHAFREVGVAVLIAALGSLATVGLQPSLDVGRFEYVTLGLSLAGAFGVVYRLGAGLHGLGRRGIFAVVFGTVVLALTLAYAELLARYGTPVLVEWIFDAAGWLRDTLGASPRPIIALLGIPALVWGTHMRARRRQGWWVCAFGVGATAPIAQALIEPTVAREEVALAIGYGVLVGLALGVLAIRVDLTLTGQRGRGARRAEETAAIRPEPARIEALL